MSTIVKFDPLNPDQLISLGLNLAAVSAIFLGPDHAEKRAIMTSPNWAAQFIHREYKASEVTFRGVTENIMHVPDPTTNRMTPHKYTFIPYQHRFRLSVFKVFGEYNDVFVLVFAGATGRVTHLILPKMELVIYDLDLGGAQYSIEIFNNFLKSNSTKLSRPSHPNGRVGVVDMLSNYAHQLMNYLSGIQRLLDSDIASNLDEIWISGVEFFGPTENIFPELKEKIKHKLWSNMPSELERRNLEAFKINSNIFTRGLQARILQLATSEYPRKPKPGKRSPIAVVTVRAQDRKCVNLPDVVGDVVAALLVRHPNLGIILDGFVFPEVSIIARSNVVTALSSTHLETLRIEAELCVQIAARLPPDVLVDNLLGMPILQSISALQCADVYLAHIGTLQHKLAWFTNICGVVHGPRSQLSRLETGPFASETGHAPLLINQDAVSDITIESGSGDRFNDYKIDDTTDIVNQLDQMLSSRSAPRLNGDAP
jgi:hypothetical protein